MNKLQKTLFYILILCIATVHSGCSKKAEPVNVMDEILKRGKIIVGVKYDTKPFGYLDEHQKLVGYDIDLAKYIAKSVLGSEDKVEFRQVTPSNRILALNSGQVDMIIATMTITEQRQEVVDFSVPYYMAGQAILVPKDSKIKRMGDLNGKKVIIIFGTTAEKNLRLVAPEAKILGYKTYTSGYSALKQKRADAMTSDDTILIGFALQDSSLTLLPKRYSKEPYAIAFKKGEGSAELRGKVDFIIEDMAKKGKLNRLKEKWIKY